MVPEAAPSLHPATWERAGGSLGPNIFLYSFSTEKFPVPAESVLESLRQEGCLLPSVCLISFQWAGRWAAVQPASQAGWLRSVTVFTWRPGARSLLIGTGPMLRASSTSSPSWSLPGQEMTQ